MIEDLTWLLVRWWWLVVAPAVVAAVLAFVWVSGQPDYYVSTGTYVVQPRQLDASNQLRAIQALINTEAPASRRTARWFSRERARHRSTRPRYRFARIATT